MEAGDLVPGSEEVVRRAYTSPYGAAGWRFILEGLEKGVPDAARKLLEMNVDDERNHDIALDTRELYGTDEKLKRRQTFQKGSITRPHHLQAWWLVKHLLCYPPLLPCDAGLRTVSADISRDEQIHVATNSLVCRELGLSHSSSLDKLRKATMQWMLEPLAWDGPDKFLTKKFWADSSDRLMYEGKAPQLSVTKSARMPAFFEHSNVNLPQYA